MHKILYLLISLLCSVTFTSTIHAIDKLNDMSFKPAIQLTDWYHNNVNDCGGEDEPAYLCSGLMIRNTSNEDGFNSWDPSPQSVKSGGISFSWIRADFKYSKPYVDTHHGYILFPQSEVSETATIFRPHVLCGFPYDADTWKRNPVCGKHLTDMVGNSAPCETINVNDAISWVLNFDKANKNRLHQCGFNFEEGEPSRANRLLEMIKVRFYVDHFNKELSIRNNEFIIQTWPKGIGERLPIHSFYYDYQHKETLKYAQRDQVKYYNLYGKVIPIVAVTSPTSLQSIHYFSYFEDDQKI